MRLFDFFKKRSSDAELIFESSESERISSTQALRLSAVYACVNLLSQTISTLPFNIYERTENGSQKAARHPLSKLLSIAPNDDMNAQIFLATLVSTVLLKGNAFVRPIRARNGAIIRLDLLDSDAINIDINAKKYYYTSDQGMVAFSYKELVNVLFTPSANGIKGLTPIEQCQKTLGLSTAIDDSGTAFFKNRAMPSGVLSFDAKMSDAQFDEIRKSMSAGFKGKNAGRLMILEAGGKFSQLSINNSDAQFIEVKNFQIADIARIFRVPPHLIGELSRATFSNIEHQKIDFIDSTIRPLCESIESAFAHRLLSESEQEKFYFKFNLAGLLRGDMKSRFEAYNLGRNMGVYSANDIRRLEDLNEIDGGDIYLQPLNMTEQGAKDERNKNEINKI